MKTSIISSFIAMAALLSTAMGNINMADVTCGRSVMRSSRVKGGHAAKVGEFPWMVSIRINGGHFCGGVLIHNKFVLSAAHCTERRPVKFVTVVVGEYNLLNAEHPVTEQIMEVQQIFTHQNFSKRYIADISVLELKNSVVWSKAIRPLCLPDMQFDGTNNPLDNSPATLAGWGWSDEQANGGVRMNTLQKATLKIVPKSTCQTWYTENTGKPLGDPQSIVLYDTHICAGLKNGDKDACQGDSGGPLMVRDSQGQQVIVGIVSSGIGCGRPGLPGLYTRVSRYLDWIQTTVRAAQAAAKV
ncbi:Serine proteases trypsin domain [Trinorchestia longiramus]|nr:Serine proteases trypsin domain [Trinorchestia longiramus]